MPSDTTPTFWQCPECRTGLAVVRYPTEEGESPTSLYCPNCGRSIEAIGGTRDLQIDKPNVHTPHTRRRAYKCAECETHYHSTEILDIHMDRLVFHVAQIARFFSHAHVASNLGIEGTDREAPLRDAITMRVHGQGKVRSYSGKHAKLLQAILAGGKSVKLQDLSIARGLRYCVKEYDLPIRVLRGGGAYWALPEGAWHQGQVYGDENDERFSRITFALTRPPGKRGGSGKDD